MVIISDTTCISTLARIGELDILHQLFQEVIIPGEVLNELLALNTFGVDVSIFSKLTWLKILNPKPGNQLSSLLSNQKIDAGEAHTIALALELQADWIILDDLNARVLTTQLNLNVTGLGGILLQAKAAGIITAVKPLLDRCMQQANFRLAVPVYQKILQLAVE